LALIESHLAAHNWAVSSGYVTNKTVGSVSESYTVTTDFFLKGTPMGQNAMLLDTNHCLAQLMADTDMALQGRQSFAPEVISLHSNKVKSFRRARC